MRTFLNLTSGQRGHALRALKAARGRLDPTGPRGEEGFLLVEVMMSALLVGLIVVATFNGLDVATKLSADQRRHDEAAVLAAQSQEQLRSEPASALDALETSPHSYTRIVGGTLFTITQEAKAAGKSGKETTSGCSVTDTASETNNIQISSTVTWPQLKLAKTTRPGVKEASVITPPTGSNIEVDVINGVNAGVSGITARATFTPVESGSANTIEGTTDSAGCVVLSGIQATSAEVEILERTGYVTRSGALKVPNKKLTIAPNITTHYVVPYAEAGRIAARYTYNGATTFGGKEVVGDTFVAQHIEEMETEPKYEVGSTFFEYEKVGEEKFTPILGTCNTATACVPRNKVVPAYEPTAYTAAGSKYPNGDLFPFKEPWRVWAGDCEANAAAEAVVTSSAVTSGATTTVNVPLALTELSVYKGPGPGKPEEFEETHLGPVKITNQACASAPLPPNAKAQTFVHEQKETLAKGRLEDPFQPFGTFKLCLVDKGLNKSYRVPFTNVKAAVPSTPTIYLGQRPNAEISSERAAKEAEYKAKEAYKGAGGYENKGSEAKTEKEKYEAEKIVYTNDLGKYNAEKTVYTNDLSKYNTEKTAYTNDLSKYETEKTAYTKLKEKYEAEKTLYNTKKAAYEAKKKEYEKSAAEGGKKASQKTEYEKLQKEYKKAETEYKKYETEYKTAETKYKTYETEYKAAKLAYEKYEGEYKTAKTAYEKYEGEYKTAEAKYKEYEAAYKLDEQQATEYQYYLEWKAAKAAYEKAKAEEEEAEKSGVTVEAGLTC